VLCVVGSNADIPTLALLSHSLISRAVPNSDLCLLPSLSVLHILASTSVIVTYPLKVLPFSHAFSYSGFFTPHGILSLRSKRSSGPFLEEGYSMTQPDEMAFQKLFKQDNIVEIYRELLN
jgi:hypothetical protein